MEEYRDIADFPDYQVSNLGNVRSNHSGEWKQIVKCMMGPYYGISLCKNGVQLSAKIHRLVAKTFILNAENKPTVDHIDRNKLNNCVENLRWANGTEQNLNRFQHLGVLNERHISMYKSKFFRVDIRRKGILKTTYGFNTLDEAKAWRDEQLLLF